MPRKQIPLEYLGQNIFFQIDRLNSALITTCFTQTDEDRGAHFTEGKAGACRGEGFNSSKGTGRNMAGLSPVSHVLSHGCNNTVTNVLPSSLYQEGEWQHNDVRHWQNVNPQKPLCALCTERTRVYNPRHSPGSE